MKNYLSLLLAIAAVFSISCTKELDNQNLKAPTNSHVVFKAQVSNNPMSKATITPNGSDTVFSSAWEDGDAVNLYALSNSFDEEAQADWNTSTLAFEGDFSASAPGEKEEWMYEAKYPYDDDGNIPFGSTREQRGNAYNSAYDIMYGTVSYTNAFLGQDNSGNVFVIPMTRLTGIAYFHISGGPSSDDVLSATLTVNSGNIAAETVEINGSGDALIPTNASNSITINFPSGYRPKANDIKLWFNVLPGSYSGMKLVVRTATKAASVASNKSITYTAGELNKAVFDDLNWVNTTSHSITWDTSSDWDVDVVDGIGIEDGDYLVELHQAVSATAPAIAGKANEARVYNNGQATITYSGYAMSRIVFNLSSQGTDRLGPITANTGTITSQAVGDNVVIWTGKAKTVTFTVPDKATLTNTPTNNAQLCFTSIDIETVDDGLSDAGISFASDAYTALTNKSFVAPTLSNPNSVSVTYSSTNTAVATVNESTGAITVVAEGETTIKATFAGNATYRAAVASYTLSVANPSIVASATTPTKAGYADNSEVSFTVTANCAWEAVKGTDVNSIIKSVNVSENTVTVRFNANTEESEKTATVNLNQTGADSSPITVPVTVTQNAKPGAAAKGATLWSEDFSGLDANATPTEGTAEMYGGGKATYSYNPSRSTIYTKVYTSGGPGTGNNLLISYSSRNDQYWAITGIPTSGWSSFTLTYKANTDLTLTGTSGVSFVDISVDGNVYVKKVSVSGSPVTFGITFTNPTASSNARIDDVVIQAGVPDPYITVSTAVASSLTATGATLNGTISLFYLAEIGTVTSAGFYYKKTASLGDYTKVPVTTPLGTNTFSKELTGLDAEEYTYYAYAAYNSGDEVTGSTKTFTPTSTPAGADPDANGICFNITSYSSLPTGWDCSGVTTNASYFIVDEDGYMISPSYNLSDYDSATVSVSIRNYGSGTNSAVATLYISYDGGTSWSESTNWTATSSDSAKTYNLNGALTDNVAIKIANTASNAKDLRVFKFKLQGSVD